MARFPTEATRSIVVNVPMQVAYDFLADVAGSSTCVPGIESCLRVDDDTYEFIFEERSTGPVSLTVRYTAAYTLNGTDSISFRGLDLAEDNTGVDGELRFEEISPEETRITLRQEVAPETPVPRLVQSLIRSFVEAESATAVEDYLANVKKALES